jgi:hypothetical protein
MPIIRRHYTHDHPQAVGPNPLAPTKLTNLGSELQRGRRHDSEIVGLAAAS